jgi:hypothetical protein
VPIYRVESAPDKVSEVRAVACSVSGLVQLKREPSLISTCNIRRAGGLETMQGCTLRLANAGRDGGVICARALAGRTGELPADHGLASSGRGTAAGRSRGRLAQSLDASRQSVILLRRHLLLTNLHYCYRNKPCALFLNKSHLGPVSRYGAGQGSHVSIDPVCHSCITEDARRFALKFLPRPIGRAPSATRRLRRRHCRSQYGRPVRNGASLQRDDASALRQNAAAKFLGARLMAVRSPSLTAIGYVNSYFHWDFPKFNISCVTMSRRPQYLVDSPEERCISKGRSAAITVGYWAADIRTLATKCCYEVTGGELRVSAGACPRMHRKFGKRLA